MDTVAIKGYYITITDVYSRYTEVEFLTSITTEDISKAFEAWIVRHGTPRTFICDNGTQHTSRIFDDYLAERNINKLATPMYHSASNGISERLNQTIAEVLRMNKEEYMKAITEKIMKRLNINYHRGIKRQPIAIALGYSEFEPLKTKR